MSARFRLVGALALLLMLTALATTNAPSAEATVTLPCNSYWAYAGQFTGSVNGDYVCPTNPYWGYVGVDGNIETPSALPSALTSDDHSLGFTSALFNNYAAWLQVGWMAGYIGDPGIHIQSFTQYRCTSSRRTRLAVTTSKTSAHWPTVGTSSTGSSTSETAVGTPITTTTC